MTLPNTKTKTTMKAIDLGLSIKWADCNIGAATPEEYGDYFAWGETKTKKTYKQSNCKFANKSRDFGNDYARYNQYDGKTTLDLADDAANVIWGGKWRMPTDAEWTELRTNCIWTWTTLNGINGYEVKSKTNGNFIFLPAAGYRDFDGLFSAGSYGYYWSSSLITDYPDSAWGVNFLLNYMDRGYDYRYYGQSVRPVL